MIFALTQNQEMKLDYNSTLKKYNDETFLSGSSSCSDMKTLKKSSKHMQHLRHISDDHYI